ncbi:MAG: putative toxin-antitoxin system toxin component, PIN family [Chloroflexota bacterium]|nr:putative toxin-antitoxin system toxin component, PIN family [Chloroflexota bacterium]
MISAVFDTNVLASGLVGETRPESTPGELLRRWRARRFTLVVSEPILAELERTLTNPYFSNRFPPAAIAEIITRISTEAHVQRVTVSLPGVATHPEDDAILATALSGGIAWLVTGDRQLQQRGVYSGTRLLSPRQFLEFLDREV